MEFPDTFAWWDTGKKLVAKILQNLSREKTREMREEEDYLRKELKTLMDQNHDTANSILDIKRKLRKIEEHAAEGVQVRAREERIGSNGKNLKFFDDQEKIKAKEKTISEIKDSKGNIIREKKRYSEEYCAILFEFIC